MSRAGIGLFFVISGIGLVVLGMAGDSVDSDNIGLDFILGSGGGVFTMIGVIWALVGVFVLLYYARVSRKRAGELDLLQTGVRVTGTIEGVEMTATTINHNPVVGISVRVPKREGGEFIHQERLAVPVSGVPLPGHLIDVAYDPADPSRVALDFDPRLSAPPARYLRTRPPGQSAAVPEPHVAVPAPYGPQTTTPAPAAGNAVQDTIGALERLNELRESGALTDAELQAEKLRILGSGA